ncbi:hypothetical protein AVEN_235244-1 [Araneus ventricosus]|uniref:Transmembrane protein n=1 Tax=Araneus ventricosus TaxID=182803 RepID=A0A4Y2A489_ARAVE|nr:hypothetical protein AVEN_235244-1 [Araneus ventricosus]
MAKMAPRLAESDRMDETQKKQQPKYPNRTFTTAGRQKEIKLEEGKKLFLLRGFANSFSLIFFIGIYHINCRKITTRVVGEDSAAGEETPSIVLRFGLFLL